MEFPTIDKFAKGVAEKALDEITYEGKILGNEVFELTKLHTVNPKDNPKADAMAYGVNWSLNTLMELSSVTPERPKGKWIEVDPLGIGHKAYMCSKCKTGDWSITVHEYQYCPYCGAEMSGGEDDEDDKVDD